MERKKKVKKHTREDKILNELCLFMLSECVDGFTVLESEFEYQKLWVAKIKEREPFKFQFIAHKNWQEEFDLAVEHLALLKNTASRKRKLLCEFGEKMGGYYEHSDEGDSNR